MVGDIAMLRAALPIARKFQSDPQAPLRLPDESYHTAINGEQCYIFGYGSDSYDGPISRSLHYGTVLALDLDSCIGMMGAVVAPPPDSGMFCAIGRSDACKVSQCCIRSLLLLTKSNKRFVSLFRVG